MDDEVLSAAEIQSLLEAMDDRPAPKAAAGEVRETPRTPLRERVIPYDFKRPERVGKEQMRVLQSLHDGLSRNFAAALSALLRTLVDIRVTSVDQLTYSEFVFSLENPTCFNLLRVEPLQGGWIADINPSILYPMIDRMLGGGRDPAPPARRPLTEIELRLVSRITSAFLGELRRAWLTVMDLTFAVDRVESNAQLVQVVPPNEVVILISFELTMGEARGMLNLCIPYNSIERISTQLSANNWAAAGQREPTPESIALMTRQLGGSRVELVVTLAETQITTADLIGLRIGDIITTDKDVHTPLEVCVEGIPKFHAHPGALKGRKAIQLEGPVALPAIAQKANAQKASA